MNWGPAHPMVLPALSKGFKIPNRTEYFSYCFIILFSIIIKYNYILQLIIRIPDREYTVTKMNCYIRNRNCHLIVLGWL